MAEENQVQQEPQQVTAKNLKKVEAGKRLAAHNHKKREVKKREEQAQLESGLNQYYSIGAVIAVGVIGLGYYIYRTKKGPVIREVMMSVSQPSPHPRVPVGPYSRPYKMDKKSIVNDLYQAAVISVLAVGYSMLGQNILCMTPPKHSKIRSGRHRKTGCHHSCIREYLIKQKILPDHINV